MSQLVRDAGPTKGKLTTQKVADYYMQGGDLRVEAVGRGWMPEGGYNPATLPLTTDRNAL